jgi:cephalosporin hydroxylase
MQTDPQETIDAFYQLYMTALPNQAQIIRQTRWMNVPCFKLPQDLWVYQEIIQETKPDLIIETGTFLGGSTLFIAHMLDLVNHGRIISIDIQKLPRPAHPRIQYVHGSSVDAALVRQLLESDTSKSRMVILDSDHHFDHVALELALWAEHVTPGGYLIVEDMHMSQNPMHPNFGPGPREAVQAFLLEHPEFIVDSSREKFLLSFNAGGYLKRIAE